MKRFFKPKHPKIILLIATIILSYLLFKQPVVSEFLAKMGSLSYLGVFIAGFLFSFGFSAAFAVGFFAVLNPSNIWLAVVIGGIGSVIADLLLFNLIKSSFDDEIKDIEKKLEKTKPVKEVEHIIKKDFNPTFLHYLMYVFAGILIATPLPDEFGITMLASISKVNQFFLALISFILHAAAILFILWI